MTYLFRVLKALVIVLGVVLMAHDWTFTERIRQHDSRIASAEFPYCSEKKSNYCLHMSAEERNESHLSVAIWISLVLVGTLIWELDKRKKRNATV